MMRSKISLTYAPTEEEISKMLETALKMRNGERHYLMIMIQYNLILRINEVLKIVYPRDISDDMIYIQATKNNDNRWRKCPKWLIERIREYASKNNIKEGSRLFPISTTMAERIIRKIAEKSGVQRTRTRLVNKNGVEVPQTKYYITSHSIRSSATTHAIQKGANLEAIKQFGGWKSRDAFERYIKSIITERDISLLHNSSLDIDRKINEKKDKKKKGDVNAKKG